MGLVKLHIVLVLFTLLILQRRWGFANHLHYTLTTKYFCGSPDGVKVCHILGANGKFPGPTIRASINDTLHVTVRNHIQPGFDETKTSIHWHGIFQRGSPFQDGKDAVTQCPLPRLNSQTYVFKVEQSGTYWWHSHVGYQFSEGLWGALIIDNKPEVYADEYDDEILITLSDWYHTPGSVNMGWFLSPASHGNMPIPFSNLINGRGRYPCNATQLSCSDNQPVQEFKVTRGKRYRIRVINASSSIFYFYIQNHKLTVIEVDGVDTIKRNVNGVINVTPGQRYSVIAEMNAIGNEHWIVAETAANYFKPDEPNINPNPQDMIPRVFAKLVYGNGNAGQGKLPYPPSVPENPGTKFGLLEWELSLLPVDGKFAPRTFDQEIVLNVETVVDAKGVHHLTFNNIIYRSGQKPLLGLVLKNRHIPFYANPFYTKYNQVVQIVVNNRDTEVHTFHLHGHTFWLIGKGNNDAGDFTPSRDVLNLNRVRRDTTTVGTSTWMVLRFVTDNPGVWLFHCHVNWHLEGGLAATIIEAPEKARRDFRIPLETKRVCKSVGVKI